VLFPVDDAEGEAAGGVDADDEHAVSSNTGTAAPMMSELALVLNERKHHLMVGTIGPSVDFCDL
jgi:hypothetical protein